MRHRYTPCVAGPVDNNLSSEPIPLAHFTLSVAAVSTIRFHDLRHTAATLLLSRGLHPKVVGEMPGHADIAITLGVYAHVTPHMQEAAIDIMESLLGVAQA